MKSVGGAEPTDETLMLQFCEGDARSFELLFQRYGSAIRAYLSRSVGPTHAEDLTQITFLSVVRGRGRFDPKAKFKPWLFAIATNATRDLIRRRRSEEVTATGELPDRAETSAAPERDEGVAREIQRALAELPEPMRLPILMHRFHNLSFAEIARALDASESAVKVRAHRGYKRLRLLLQKLWENR
jgi:RNA polymerase sigma factor (sigma-70 family)